MSSSSKVVTSSQDNSVLGDNKITYLSELNNSKEYSTIKVRIIRLWENRNPKPPHDLWTMEMVLVDEKGNKMRASMLTKIFLKFGTKVKLNETLLITNTVLADLKLNQRILGRPHKISFSLSTQMVLVDDFIGEPFAFSFESFADVNANKFDQHQIVG
ncbi:uncharacterized protein LOC143591211 [Bidens hawaiensis]|uniref:uncharacterized protein LOC143591211 n=1 Tax=Bidens hawaiensis TaxID=980011 RepID=UPI004049168B